MKTTLIAEGTTQLNMFSDLSELAEANSVEVGLTCGRSMAEQAAFDYAQSKGAELPETYVSPYGVESRLTASMRSVTRSDYEDGSKPKATEPFPVMSYRVLCEDERPMSGWFKSETDARKFAEGYNVRHFQTIGNSTNPRNPLRI